jgi:hypothetical protein
MSYRLDVDVRAIRVAMTDVKIRGEVYTFIVSVIETIGIEGEGILPMRMTDA